MYPPDAPPGALLEKVVALDVGQHGTQVGRGQLDLRCAQAQVHALELTAALPEAQVVVVPRGGVLLHADGAPAIGQRPNVGHQHFQTGGQVVDLGVAVPGHPDAHAALQRLRKVAEAAQAERLQRALRRIVVLDALPFIQCARPVNGFRCRARERQPAPSRLLFQHGEFGDLDRELLCPRGVLPLELRYTGTLLRKPGRQDVVVG